MKNTPFTAAIITRFFQGTLGTAQHQQVLDWLSTLSSVEQDQFFDAHLNYLGAHADPEVNPMLATGFPALRTEIERRKETKKHTINWSLRIAAALFPLLLVYFLFHQPQAKINASSAKLTFKTSKQLRVINPGKENREIILPDSSVVILHPGAVIEYAAVFVQSKRALKLTGKAFFRVAHDVEHPFIVHTGEVETVVLGTSFWIDATKGAPQIKVTVKTGKVGVKHRLHPTIFLLPSEIAVFSKSEGTLAKVHSAAKKDPVKLNKNTGQPAAIAFNQTPLAQVLTALEQQFHVSLSLKDEALARHPITLTTRGKSLTVILKEINVQTQEAANGSNVNAVNVNGANVRIEK